MEIDMWFEALMPAHNVVVGAQHRALRHSTAACMKKLRQGTGLSTFPCMGTPESMNDPLLLTGHIVIDAEIKLGRLLMCINDSRRAWAYMEGVKQYGNRSNRHITVRPDQDQYLL
jgi:hypothetical protein